MQPITDTEWHLFVDQNQVEQNTIRRIAHRIQQQQQLTEREISIYLVAAREIEQELQQLLHTDTQSSTK